MTVNFIKLKEKEPVVLELPICAADEAAERKAIEERAQERLRKVVLEKIVADKRFAQVVNYSSNDKLPNSSAINRYFQSLFIPNFASILDYIGHSKMQQLLKNLLHLNEQTKGHFEAAVALVSEKCGLGEIKDKWETLCKSGTKDKDALLALLVEVEDLCLSYPALETRLPPNLRMIFSFYKQSKSLLLSAIDKGIEAFLSEDAHYPEFVKNYSHLNGSEFRDELLRGALLPRLPIENLTDAAFLNKELKKAMQEISPCASAHFISRIREKFKARYGAHFSWLRSNRNNLKRVLSQQDRPHTNVKAGTCYENCSARHAQILKASTIENEQALLESTQRGRRVTATKSLMAKLDASATNDSVEEFRLRTFGLKKSHSPIGFNRPEGVDLLRFDARPFILVCRRSQGGGGHAINVQYDPIRQVYLFIDDNYGLFEYSSVEERNKQLITFLKTLYPYDLFQAEYLELR